MQKIKLSWSTLSQWSKGNHQEALMAINGIQPESNVYMEYGTKIHDIISSKKMKLIPEVKDTAIFEDISPEAGRWTNYFKAPVEDWLDLSMVVDVLDRKEKLVIDWKTGYQKSMEHNKLQVYIYAYGLSKLGVQIDTGIIAHVKEDQQGAIYCDDYTVYKITPDKLDVAENYIITNASEIYNILYSKS